MNDSTQQAFRLVPVASVLPWPGNPRKRFDPEALAELTASVRAKGILQPILVRPRSRFIVERSEEETIKDADGNFLVVWDIVDTQKKKLYERYCDRYDNEPEAIAEARRLNEEAGATGWEIVAGERRWRAAQAAGMELIPVLVHDLSDRDMLEIAVTENEQRSDVTVIEKAVGYQRLVQEHGVTVEDLAARVGTSSSTVRGLLKLLVLPKTAQAALEDGTLAPAIAGLVARIPGKTAREKAAEIALSPGWGGSPPTFREMKGIIERDFMAELKGQPFDRKSLTLLPEAGSCEACPKRTGNDPVEYPDARADICTDPDCLRRKVSVYSRQVVAKAQEKGQTVLPRKEADNLFDKYSPGRLTYDSDYYELSALCHEDTAKKQRTYKQLLGKELEAEVVVAVDSTGLAHELILKKTAHKHLKEKGVIKGGSNGHLPSDEWKKKDAQRRKEDLLAKEVARRCMGEVAAAAERIALKGLMGPETNAGRDLVHATRMIRILVAGVVDAAWSETNKHVAKRRGLEQTGEGAKGVGGVQRAPVAALVDDLDGPGLLGLLAEIVAGRQLLMYGSDARNKETAVMLEFFGVDKGAVEKSVKAEQPVKGKKQKLAPPPENPPEDVRPDVPCHRCGLTGGMIADDPALADDPTDLVTLSRLGEDMIACLPRVANPDDTYVCAGCVDEMEGHLKGKKKRKARA